MKRLLLLFIVSGFSLSGYAQTPAAIDTAKRWTIHGENTFLINQSSFSNRAAGGLKFIYDDKTKIAKDDGSGESRSVLQIKQIFGAGLTYKF